MKNKIVPDKMHEVIAQKAGLSGTGQSEFYQLPAYKNDMNLNREPSR